jgi:hypothetical protein
MRKPAADRVVFGLVKINPTRRQAPDWGHPGGSRDTVF